MRWLNYHHLLYFWTVARTGSIAAASRELFLSAPAISTQIKSLEAMFGTPLFARSGRGLELTDAGRKAYAYADQIFRLGNELREALQMEGGRTRLRVGLSPMTAKLLSSRWLAPLFAASSGTVVECREATGETLASLLSSRELDLVISDEEFGFDRVNLPDAEHLARVEYGLFARPGVIDLRRSFPECLDGAPVLMPGSGTALRARLTAWFDQHEVAPEVVGEGDDGMLLLELARGGAGIIAAPLELRGDLATIHGLELAGPAEGVHANVFLTTTHALRSHPAVSQLVKGRGAAVSAVG